MWGVVHNLIKPAVPEQLRLNAVADGADTLRNIRSASPLSPRKVVTASSSLWNFVDEKTGDGHWSLIDRFAPDREFRNAPWPLSGPCTTWDLRKLFE